LEIITLLVCKNKKNGFGGDTSLVVVTHLAKVLVAKPLTSSGDQCFALMVVTLTKSSPIVTLNDHHSLL
jgi:hypothetical protein